jgi:ketosteroid isomerase-like protein
MVAAFKVAPASTAKFYTDDAVVVGGGSRVIGRQAVDAYWSEITPGSTWDLESLASGEAGGVPFVHGRSTLRMGGGDRASITDFVGLLRRGDDGQLRFYVDAYTGASRPATRSPGDEAAVRGLDSLWARMYATHDTAVALQLYAEPLVFISANGSMKTRAQELADVRTAPGLKMDYFRSTPVAVHVYDRLALVSGNAEWSFSVNGGPARRVQRGYTAIYVRGGPLGWRILTQVMR